MYDITSTDVGTERFSRGMADVRHPDSLGMLMGKSPGRGKLSKNKCYEGEESECVRSVYGSRFGTLVLGGALKNTPITDVNCRTHIWLRNTTSFG